MALTLPCAGSAAILAAPRSERRACVRVQAASSSSGHQHGSTGRAGKQHRSARAPGLFEVKVVAPPPRSLGIYALPPLTHNGEEIEVDGQGFVVTSVIVQMRLEKGKYVRKHHRLDVTPTGRFFLEKTLEGLLHASYVGPTGLQD